MKIITACSTGLGSSFMTQLNIEKALSNLGVTGVETDHMDIASVTPTSADVLFVGRDIAEAAEGLMDDITAQVAAALKRHGVEVPNK